MKTDEIVKIVEKHAADKSGLIAILEDIQAKYSYLPADALKAVAEKTGRSLVDIYGVATFYRSFSLEPRGKHLCSVCLGTACHVRGAPMIAEEFERQLEVKAGNTTPDKEFTLKTVNCVGACALGPIVVMDGHYFSNVRTEKVKKIIQQTKIGLDAVEVEKDRRVFPVEVACPRCNHTLMDKEKPVDSFPSIHITVASEGKHGWVRLSSLYGSYNLECEHIVPSDAVTHFFCPHCHGELLGAADCPECGAPMVAMKVRAGGLVQICARRGCKGHMLDVASINY